MIEAHTVDSWTRVADRNTAFFRYLTILGGFAAPLFLWLAGLGVAMSAARTCAKTGSRARAVEAACRRGLEIFVLAFLFRLQAFIVSPGSHPVTLFRVDVLNVMGPAMVAAGLVWAVSDRAAIQVIVYAATAILVAMATPVARAAPLVDALPVWLQWYIRPAGEYTTFTLLPWAGFVMAGAAIGVLIVAVRDERSVRRMLWAVGLTGAVLAAVGYAASFQPTIYSVPSGFWTSSPTWFAMRTGIMMAALAVLAAVPERPGSAFAWQPRLATLGRASLFVYWIHVELVYGYASWPWHRRLPAWGSVISWIVFSALMYRAVITRDRFMARRRGPSTFQGAATLSQA